MKKAVAVLLLALLVTCCILPVTTQAVTVKREFAQIVNVDSWCNMRAKPTVESEIVARVNRGDRVILLCWNEDETWCFVDYNGKMGWINVQFLKSEGLKDVEVIGAALPTPKPVDEPEEPWVSPEPSTEPNPNDTPTTTEPTTTATSSTTASSTTPRN